MSEFGEKLTEALKSSKLDSYIWKGPKKVVNDKKVQDEIKLVDATESQLRSFYNHCMDMLYNKDKNNPGRFVLLDLIKEQRKKCNVELYLRWLSNVKPGENRKGINRILYMSSLRTFLDNNSDKFPVNKRKEISISSTASNIPEEFESLDIDSVMDGCLDRLGLYNKQHLTLSLIANMGLWFTASELKELNESAKELNTTRDQIVLERCNLKPTFILQIHPKGILNFIQFRALVQLRNKKYSEMTTDQLLTLRDKALYYLEDEVSYHIQQWQERINMLKEVAAQKGYSLND